VQNPGFARELNRWPALGIDGVLTYSRPDGGASFMQRYLNEQGNRLPMFGVPNPFLASEPWGKPTPPRVPGRIICLPRKGPEYVRMLESQFGRAVRAVDGLSERELAVEYAAADVYVHTGFPEGLGMPIAEAMLSGCIACGFTGGGGNDLIEHGLTGWRATDGDGAGLLAVVRLALGDAARETVRAAGLERARGFSGAAASAALETCYRGWAPTLPTKPRRQGFDLRGRLRRLAFS